MELVELKRKQYQDYELVFEYETDDHYAVNTRKDENGFSFELQRVKLGTTVKKRFVENLFQRYLVKPSVYAILEETEPVAIIEVDREFWNNRLRISDLLVRPEHRRRGYGARLVEKVKEIAVQEGFRAVFLDTVTCNTGAIDFYLVQGFVFCGIDIGYYSNTDIERNEVWLELAYFFSDETSMEWHYETHHQR